MNWRLPSMYLKNLIWTISSRFLLTMIFFPRVRNQGRRWKDQWKDRHQPFDFGSNFSKSVNDPRPLKEQATSNVMAYFMPKFIVESMLDWIYDNDGNSFRHARVHTLTYKDPNAPIAPIISRQLLRLTPLFKKNPASDQYTFKHFFHLVEEEETPHSDDVRHFIHVPKITSPFEPVKFENMFKLSLHACPFILKERLDHSSKYPKRSLASRYATVGQ